MDQDEQLTQAQERVEQILSAFAALRAAMGDGKSERHLLDEIFRKVHSLKAAAQAQKLVDLTKLAHTTEDVLHAIRIGRIRFDDHILNVLNKTAQTFLELLSRKQSANITALLHELAKISAAAAQRPKAEIEIILSSLPSDLGHSLTDEEKHKLQASITEGASLFLISTSFDIVDFDRQFQGLKDTLNKTGELISTAPTVEQGAADKIDFRILYTRQASLETITSDLAAFAGVSVSAIDLIRVPGSGVTRIPTLAAESEPSRSVRVIVEDLDQILSSAHEPFHRTDELVTSHSRWTSIESLLRRVEDAGRAAALACGKTVNFHISGQDVLLDQSVCNAIADPLIHLVRNAVDHGIEPADERSADGKRPTGTVTIKATSAQGQIRIAIRDDGRGIDPKAIEAACVRMGLTHHQFPLSLEESVSMLFRPGFTTAAAVSKTSGRGVGLDVVETEVERLGGEIRVASKPAVGSMFEIGLPVS